VTAVTAWRWRQALVGGRRREQNCFLTPFGSKHMKTFKPLLVSLAFATSAPFAISAYAQAMDHSKMGGMNMPAMKMDAVPASMTEGEVRKIDKEAKKITLKHGDIKNLDMPGMTMVFQVKEAALLDKVKAGDNVMFTAEKADGAIVVTAIESAK
jgi:Cu(I)/Ag(I) efflux system protein CusF